MNSEWMARYELAVEAAEQAGRIALGYFPECDAAGFAANVEKKSDRSPVTAADRAAEVFLRKRLADTFPDDALIGEEYGATAGTSGFRWILDPLDGTQNFLRGIPLWGTLVGLEYQGEAIAGVAVLPCRGHVYRALRGDGAFRNDRKLRVSVTPALADSLLAFSDLNFLGTGHEKACLELAQRAGRTVAFGSFYGFVMVAEGAADAMIDRGLQVWDVAAVAPIVEEAGGRLTDWSGRATIHSPDVLATNGVLHPAVQSVVTSSR